MLGPALCKQDTAQKMQKPERHTDNERDENHQQELGWQVKSKRQQDEDRYDQNANDENDKDIRSITCFLDRGKVRSNVRSLKKTVLPSIQSNGLTGPLPSTQDAAGSRGDRCQTECDVDKGEQEQPDNVHKVPVPSRRFETEMLFWRHAAAH